MICSVCGTTNPDDARFCLRCGNALAGRATEGERRIVTMLFCDVVGSTAMAERLDPEAWTEIMNEVFELLMAPIRRYEGTLARLMGDAIFAFFGAPTAHEDDPTRAVSAGLEIVDAIRAYRDGHDAELNVRVGINTGPVVVGEVGSDVRVEYTAMGDAVNVAARMEQTADPGSVQITADTAGLVRGSFDLGPARDVQVRGKEDPVVAHQVLGRARPAAGMHVSGATPLVGRDHEMSILRRAVDEAIGGRGRIRHPARLGDLAMRLLRHDASVRAILPDGREDRGHRRYRPARGRAPEARRDRGARSPGVARAAHARVALALRRTGARRGTARRRGLPKRDHGSRPEVDAVLRRGAAHAGLRGPPLVRRRVDGPPDRDREGQ
ncbi:MAG: zinc-ribbon domain-containing protein [Actinobacteria bacterium]|nr:MAG: zinc-ribbon domain-containing protein [Actinomycetota bacterium]